MLLTSRDAGMARSVSSALVHVMDNVERPLCPLWRIQGAEYRMSLGGGTFRSFGPRFSEPYYLFCPQPQQHGALEFKGIAKPSKVGSGEARYYNPRLEIEIELPTGSLPLAN